MARCGENIYKRKDGRYEGRYVIGKKPNGRTKFGYIYGYKQTEVRSALLLKKAELFRSTQHTMLSRKTFGTWAEEWCKNDLNGSVKPSSYQTYLGILNRHLLPVFACVPLCEITEGMIREFIEMLEGKKLAQSSVKGIVRVLSTIFKSAIENGLIFKNPCQRIRIKLAAVGSQRILSHREQSMMTQYIQGDRKTSKNLPSLMSLYTGMRLGEICALRWRDIDWERNTMTIRNTVLTIYEYFPLKQKRSKVLYKCYF